MRIISDAQRQAGRDWMNLKTQRRAEKQKAIIRFLRMNPDSTSDDIWIATKSSWDEAAKFLKRRRRTSDRRMVYRVDEIKFAAYFK